MQQLNFTIKSIISLIVFSTIFYTSNAQICGGVSDLKSSYYDSLGINRNLRVMDRFGNEYIAQDLKVQEIYQKLASLYPIPLGGDSTAYTPFISSYTCYAGLFKIHFAGDTAGFGFHIAKNREIVCQVFKDLSKLILDINPSNPNRVNIWVSSDVTYLKVRNTASPSGSALAFASPYIVSPRLSTNFFSESSVARNIRLGRDFSNDFPKSMLNNDFMHGNLVVRFSQHNFDTTYKDTIISSTKYDLYSVVLHEVLHLMGVFSSVSPSGVSVYGNNVYTQMDKFLTFGSDSTKRLLSINSNYDINFNSSFSHTNRGCMDTFSIKFYGKNLKNKQMYSPSNYSPGSFLSHLACTESGSCATFKNSLSADVMNFCTDKGKDYIKRRPSLDEVKLLCDLGFDLRLNNGIAIYGDDSTNSTTYKTYSSPCVISSPNCNTIGATDTFEFPSGKNSITIKNSQLIANDRDASKIKNFKANSSNGAVITKYNDSIIISYEGSSTDDYLVFTYIPICTDTNITGTKTFVYIKTSINTQPMCDPSNDCNMICKGDFEGNISNFIRYNYSQKLWYYGTTVNNSTSQFIYRNCFNPSVSCNTAYGPKCVNDTFCNFIGSAIHPSNNGNCFTYCSKLKNAGVDHVEFIHFYLKKPILPNKKYVLKFLMRRWLNSSSPMDANIMVVGDSLKPCLSELTRIDGTVSNCGFKAKRLDRLNFLLKKSDTVWKYVSDTLIVSDKQINHIMIMPDTFIRSSNNANFSGYDLLRVFWDDFELVEINNSPLRLESTASSLAPCINNQVHSITYKICSDSSDMSDSLKLNLNIPNEFIVMSNSEFKLNQTITIPKDSLKKGKCIERKLLYQLNPSLTVPNQDLKVTLNTATDNTCFSSNDQSTVTIRPIASPVSISKSANKLNPDIDDTITYTITICNISSDSISNIQFRDTIKPELYLIDKGNFNMSANVLTKTYNLGKPFSSIEPKCISDSYKAIVNNSCPFQNCATIQHPTISCINAKSCVNMNSIKKDSMKIKASKPRLCIGDTLILEVQNWKSYGDYSWWDLNGAFHAITSDSIIKITAGGKYKLKFERQFGCTLYDSITILTDSQPKLNKTISYTPCRNKNSSISISAYGGKAPYSYKWENNSTSSIRSNLSNGSYQVIITDSNGCKKRDTSIVFSTSSSLIINVSTHSYNCATNTISLQATVSGGIPFSYPYYQLLWSNGATIANPSNVSVVNYPNMKLIVTDAVGCKDSITTQINNWIDIGSGTIYPKATSFTNTSVLTGKIRLYGTFTVDKQFSFVDAEIAANSASKIVVNKTSQNKPISLSSKNSRFYSCTDKLWKGIEIGDSCAIFMTNSIVEDALYAIEIKNRARKELNTNTFRNNFIAIFQTPTTANHIIQSADYDRDIWFNDIINNTFTGKGSNYIKLAPSNIEIHSSHVTNHSKIYTHTQAWAAAEFNNSPYIDYFYNNKISNMANGVITNNCHRVNLSGSQFSSIQRTNFPYPNSPIFQGICIFNMDYNNKPRRVNTTNLVPTISNLEVKGLNQVNSQTRFSESHWGIFSFKTDLVVSKARFDNMNSIGGGNMLSQVWYNDNTATACKSGAAFHQNTSYDLNVNNNVFQITGFDTSSGALDIVRTAGINKLWFTASSISKNNIHLLNTTGFGIRTHNYQRVNNNLNGTIENKVQDNYINLARPDKALAGIQYNNSHIAEYRNEVYSNSRTITNNMRKPIGTYPVGIHYNETQGAFSCNKTYSLRTGMLYSLNCKNAKMSKNKFFNNTSGLKLDNTSTVRSDTSNGNTWLGAWTGTGIRAAENLQSPLNTFYFVRNSAPTIFWPVPRFPSVFFRSNPRSGSENDYCPNGGSGIGIGQEWYAMATPVSFLDLSINQQIMDGSLSYDVYDPELVYQGEQMLLEELYNIEDLLADSSDAHDFLIAHDTTNMGRFLRIKKDERDAFEPTASEKTSAQGLKAAIELVQTRRWELDSILYTLHDTTPPPIITDTAYEPDTTLAAPNGYVLEYQILTSRLDSLQYEMFILDSAINTRAFPIMDTLWVRNAAIEPANTTETLQKLFNSVHYKTHAKRIGDLSPEQLATYRYLARQCPALNADVVYKSRAAILSYDGNVDYQDYDTCFSVGIEYKSTKQPRNITQKETKKLDIQLYPNPAKDKVYIRFSSIPISILKIIVRDLQGKIIQSSDILLNSNIIEIETNDLVSGVYLINILEGKQEIYSSKITINK